MALRSNQQFGENGDEPVHGYVEPRTAPRAFVVAFVQLFAATLILSLLVRAVADDWEIADTAAQVGIAMLLFTGIALYRRRQGGRGPIGGSISVRLLFAGLVMGPVVTSVGVATGFVLDAVPIQILVVVALAGLAIEAAALGMRRRQQH